MGRTTCWIERIATVEESILNTPQGSQSSRKDSRQQHSMSAIAAAGKHQTDQTLLETWGIMVGMLS